MLVISCPPSDFEPVGTDTRSQMRVEKSDFIPGKLGKEKAAGYLTPWNLTHLPSNKQRNQGKEDESVSFSLTPDRSQRQT